MYPTMHSIHYKIDKSNTTHQTVDKFKYQQSTPLQIKLCQDIQLEYACTGNMFNFFKQCHLPQLRVNNPIKIKHR